MPSARTEFSSLVRVVSNFFSKYAVIFSLTFQVIRHFWSFGYRVEDSAAQMNRSFLYLFEVVTICVIFGPRIWYKYENYFPDEGFRYRRLDEPEDLGFLGTEIMVVLGCFALIVIGYVTYRILCLYEKKPNFYGTMSIVVIWWSFWLLCIGLAHALPVLIMDLYLAAYPEDTYCWYVFQSDCIDIPDASFSILDISVLISSILTIFSSLMAGLVALVMGYVWLAQQNEISGWRFAYVYNGVILTGIVGIFVLLRITLSTV